MSDYNTEADNTIYGGYGEFDLSHTDSWTDEDWAQHDAELAAEWEAEAAMAYWDDDPNPYHGDYSEM